MTIEVPPTAATTTVVETPVKPDETKTTEEPTLSIQIEPPTANNENPEDLVTSNEEKQPTSAKRKALFNNPFKVTKKEATGSNTPDTPTTTAHTADVPKEHVHAAEEKATATGTTGENKITKGLGNLYTRIKQTASSHNIKDAAGTSPPPAAATSSAEHPIAEEKEAAAAAEKKTTTSSSSSSSSSSEGGDAQAHEAAETPSASANHSNTNKRQSLLSKLFGGSGKKKEEEHAEADHTTREVTTPSHEAETNDGTTPSATAVDPESEERPASPPLSRRVTGFFAKKIPSYNKKHQKSNDKAGEDHAAIDATTDATATTTTAAAAAAAPVTSTADVVATPQQQQESSEAVAAATAATGVTDAETTTNKDASPAPVTTSA